MSDLIRKKTIPMEGAPGGDPTYKPTLKKTVVKKKLPNKKMVKRKVVKKKTLKNKNIVDTKLKNVVPMLKKKVKQKVKNIKESTPKEVVKKTMKFINTYSPISYTTRAIHKKVSSLIKNRKNRKR